MKILAIQETDWIKRGPHQQHHLLERMSDRGHDVRVIDFEYLWYEDEDPEKIRTREIIEEVPLTYWMMLI